MVILYAIEPYIWVKSMETLGWKGNHPKRDFVFLFLGYYVLTLIKQFIVFYKISNKINIIIVVFMLVYMISLECYYFQGTLRKKIFYMGLFVFCIYSTDLILYLFAVVCFNVPVDVVSDFGISNIICTLASKIILIFLCYVFFFMRRNILYNLKTNKEVLPLIFGNILFGIFMFSFFADDKMATQNLKIIVVLVCAQFLLMITTFYIGYLLLIQKIKYQKVEKELVHKKKILELTNKLDDLRHDMSFHINMIQSLASQKEYGEMEAYISKTFSDIDLAEDAFDLNNYSVSITLSQAAKEARKKNIQFSHFIAIEDFILEDHEICSLLSNILKNAREAAEKVENGNRFICLEISPVKEGYQINCMNSYEVKPEFQNGKWKTIKKDAIQHGRGLGIIGNIVKKYKGSVSTLFQDNFFEINCIIPNKGRKEEHHG